ncbi:MAG: YceD family protein [bacterium]
MRINIQDIAGTEATFTFTIPASDLSFAPDELILKDEVKVTARVEKAGRKILVNGNIKTSSELECSRCLEHFTFPIDENFQILFEPYSSSDVADAEIELKKQDLDIETYKDDVIELDTIIREQILLAMPMVPLCSDACKGLCPHCGANLNFQTCSCHEKAPDSRWSKLQSLITKKTTPN